jgi:DNA (cytosine-5)-methyltransferase 1
LKSGVRFELRNRIADDQTEWSVDFYFGTSKNIITLQMDDGLRNRLVKVLPTGLRRGVDAVLTGLSNYVAEADVENMQRVWAHKGVGGTRPFMLLDELDRAGKHLIEVLQSKPEVAGAVVEAAISARFGSDRPVVGLAKLGRNAPLIAAGLLIGSTVNGALRTRHPGTTDRSLKVHSH